MKPRIFKAFEVSEISEKKFQSEIVERDINDLPAGDVLVNVYYSSIN